MSAHLIGLALLMSAAYLRSTPDLGKAEGQCRAGESGPSLLVSVVGLKDRVGRLKLEVYPANDQDFLQPDNDLIAAGKTFRRVEVAVPREGPPKLCVRVPHSGPYAVMLLHDRDGNRKFSLTIDGVGFGGNPKLGLARPKAAAATVNALGGPTHETIVLNYRHGLFGFGPLKRD